MKLELTDEEHAQLVIYVDNDTHELECIMENQDYPWYMTDTLYFYKEMILNDINICEDLIKKLE
jgi:hypothetical protein